MNAHTTCTIAAASGASSARCHVSVIAIENQRNGKASMRPCHNKGGHVWELRSFTERPNQDNAGEFYCGVCDLTYFVERNPYGGNYDQGDCEHSWEHVFVTSSIAPVARFCERCGVMHMRGAIDPAERDAATSELVQMRDELS